MNLTDQEILFCQEYIKNNFDIKKTCQLVGISCYKGRKLIVSKDIKEYLDDKRDTITNKTCRDLKKLIDRLWEASEDCFESKDYKNFKGITQELCKVMGYYKPIETKNTTTLIEETVNKVKLTLDKIKNE
jgi:hypothetical protein